MSELDLERRTPPGARATAPSPPATPAGAAAQPPWSALPVLLAGTFLIVLDFFIVNVALPSLQVQLHASTSAVEWVVAGYGLTFAVLLLAAGRIGDLWGRRRLFMLGLGLFTLASAACGAAPSAGVLIGARLAQGASAALVGPTVLGTVGALFTGADRARAIGAYATVMGVAAASGQLIGGVLLGTGAGGLGWRAVFLINLPVGVGAIVLAPRLVPETRAGGDEGVDVPGLVLATGGLTALVLPLLEGHRLGWPPWTWASLSAAPVLLGGFAVRQRSLVLRGRAALLDTTLFATRAFSAGLLAQFVLWCGQASYFLFLALYLQQGLGLTPLESGLVFTVMAVAYLVASSRAPALAARHGRAVVAAGALLLAAGHLAVLVAADRAGAAEPVAALVPGLLVTGAGMGLAITALTSTVVASCDPQRAGVVAGTLTTVQQVGNAVGVAAIGVVFFGRLAFGVVGAFVAGQEILVALDVVLAGLVLLLPRRDR